jgi:hypothetical protein
MIMDCVNDLLAQTGLDRHDIGFTIAGSCDYLSGMPFAFVQNIDGVGAWPPVYESHVEMDGAWALFEAWIRLTAGRHRHRARERFGKSVAGHAAPRLPVADRPYVMAPLGLDYVSLAGIQARALIEGGQRRPNAISPRSSRAAVAAR